MSRPKNNTIEAIYIPLARRALTASRLREKAREDEIQAKREAATAMHSVKMPTFEMDADGKKYEVRLERPWATRINVRKLYVLVQLGEFSLDDFLECISAPFDTVAAAIGDDKAEKLQETYRKGLDLIIQEM